MTSIVAILMLVVSLAAAQNISLDAQVRKSLAPGMVSVSVPGDVFQLGPGQRVNILARRKTG
jgi:hypothetical protein